MELSMFDFFVIFKVILTVYELVEL